MQTKKICLIGDYSVGKTSLFRRFISHHFSDQYITTVGVKVETRVVELNDGQSIKLVVWDIAGADSLSTIGRQYLLGAHGYLLVADGTRQNTLNTALSLHEDAAKSLGNVPFLGLLNKCDLTDQWDVADSFLSEQPDWLMTSALNGKNVEAAFSRLAQKLVEEK